MLIDTIEPDRRFVQRVRVHVDAPAHVAMRALREVTVSDMPLARFLGALRYLPARLMGRMKKPVTEQPFIDQLLEDGSVLLANRDDDIVIGGIGKYHQIIDQEPLRIPDPFFYERFEGSAYEKLAMELRAIEREGGCDLVLEARTHPLGPESTRSFARYWKVIDPMGRFVSWLMLRAAKRRAERAATSIA